MKINDLESQLDQEKEAHNPLKVKFKNEIKQNDDLVENLKKENYAISQNSTSSSSSTLGLIFDPTPSPPPPMKVYFAAHCIQLQPDLKAWLTRNTATRKKLV